MAYIGKQPLVGNFVKLDAITTSATTTFNLTNGGVAYFPQSANNCLVSLNGILQAPTDSYTISGSTIIFSNALTTNDVIDFIIVLGDVLNIGTPSDNTVSLAKLTATGTKDATTFLRGDNTFASAGGNNTPAFEAYRTSVQNVANATWVKIQYNTELFDSNNCYDNATNYRFTPTSSGKYFVYHKAQVYGNATNDMLQVSPAIYKNGSIYAGTEIGTYPDNTLHNITVISLAIIDMNGTTDYLEAYSYSEGGQSTQQIQSSDKRSAFGAFKLIGA
jgi:hypothetical protein